MNRKYINYAIFIAIVAVVVGLAVKHSRDMQNLVNNMAGENREARIAAAKELVKGEQFMDAITGELDEKRVKIVQALEDWGDKDATKQLVAFLKDPVKSVRERILLALLAIGGRSEENLQEVINGIKEGDGNVRRPCVVTLQVLGQKDRARAGKILRQTLPYVDDARLAELLAQSKPEVTALIVPKVVEYMKKEGGARGPGGDVLAALKEQREQSVALLLPLLKEKDEGVRSGASSALGKLGSPTATKSLIEVIEKDTAQVRRVAIGALALIADPAAEETLERSLISQQTDNEARAQAALGLGRIASPKAIATLITALTDFDLRVQDAAIAGLARAGERAVEPLLAALRSNNAEVRIQAARALERIASPRANAGLRAALNDSNIDVKKAAISALGFKDNREVVEPLAALLSDPDGSIASEAADALAKIGAPSREALTRVLTGNNDTAAFYAARALSQQGSEVVPLLEKASERPGATRWSAIALGNIGGQPSVDALKRIAQSTDPDAKAVAHQALMRLGVKE
jgi:HEAT repeat protein